MVKRKLSLLYKDAFLCTVFTFIIAAILYSIFVQLSILDPFEKAFKDFHFTDIYYSKQLNKTERNNKIIIINVKHANRFEIAQAINKVSNQKPKVIGLDIIFKEQRNNFMDSVLNKSIKNNANIITSYYWDKDSLVQNHPYFHYDENKTGFINLNLKDQNSVIRNFIGVRNEGIPKYSFATQLSRYAGFINTDYAEKKLNEKLAISYIGNQDSFLSFDIDEIISEDDIPALKDAIVIFGYLCDPKNNVYDIEDKHFTPLNEAYVGRSVPDTFGVVIHANIVHMLTQDKLIRKMPNSLIFILAFVLAFFVILLGMKIYKRSNLAYDLTLKVIQLLISVVLLYLALLCLRNNLNVNVAPILILSVFGIEMIDYYVYLIVYMNKKFGWKCALLDL